jgi:hypothetical protein
MIRCEGRRAERCLRLLGRFGRQLTARTSCLQTLTRALTGAADCPDPQHLPVHAPGLRGQPAMARMRRACLASAVRAASARNCEILRSLRVISIVGMLPAPRINGMPHRVTFATLWESPQESGSRAVGIGFPMRDSAGHGQRGWWPRSLRARNSAVTGLYAIASCAAQYGQPLTAASPQKRISL